jgi:hypothetical protein
MLYYLATHNQLPMLCRTYQSPHRLKAQPLTQFHRQPSQAINGWKMAAGIMGLFRRKASTQ